jgi:hypothetical protein
VLGSLTGIFQEVQTVPAVAHTHIPIEGAAMVSVIPRTSKNVVLALERSRLVRKPLSRSSPRALGSD